MNGCLAARLNRCLALSTTEATKIAQEKPLEKLTADESPEATRHLPACGGD
jgi:hypothetical protein